RGHRALTPRPGRAAPPRPGRALFAILRPERAAAPRHGPPRHRGRRPRAGGPARTPPATAPAAAARRRFPDRAIPRRRSASPGFHLRGFTFRTSSSGLHLPDAPPVASTAGTSLP